MPKKQVMEIIKNCFLQLIGKLRRYSPLLREKVVALTAYLRKSWKSIAIMLPLFLALYYLVGSWATNNIDKQTNVEIKKPDEGLTVAHAAAWLIKREVDDKMWTPNLPVIFPGYILDNMPAYQTGILSSVRSITEALAGSSNSTNLAKASELLSYPGNIWLLSKTENLALAPSSGAQYRKARKFIQSFNAETNAAVAKNTTVLKNVLKAAEIGIGKSAANLEKQVREFSSGWVDTKADDVFYLNQGKLYGYYVLLKAVSQDFQNQILDAGQYENFTIVLRTLEKGFLLDPLVVRNGNPSSLTAPNHLMPLAYYTMKSRYGLTNIITALEEK